jgi:hypothetical protein
LERLIESYDFGSIVINGTRYRSDIIITGDKIQAIWRRREGHVLHASDMRDTLEEFLPEVVVIGTGYAGMMSVPRETKDFLQTKGIELLVERTEKACRLFNTLSKSKRVLAALHLTC